MNRIQLDSLLGLIGGIGLNILLIIKISSILWPSDNNIVKSTDTIEAPPCDISSIMSYAIPEQMVPTFGKIELDTAFVNKKILNLDK
jgi:hypothetical protein